MSMERGASKVILNKSLKSEELLFLVGLLLEVAVSFKA